MTRIPRKSGEKRRFFGCRVKQRTSKWVVRYFVFYAPVKDVARWAGVRRITDSIDGTQRVLREPRVRAITRFLHAHADNSIPNSILLAFDGRVGRFKSLQGELTPVMPDGVSIDNNCENQIEWGVLEFSFVPNLAEDKRPIHIVDGQHRVHGMAGLPEENLPALIVALLDASAQEQAFQFIVVNNKAVKAPTENVKSIIEGINEDDLRERLLRAGVAYGESSPVLRDIQTLAESPFKGLLDWAFNKSGPHIVPITAIEGSLRYIKSALVHIADDDDTVAQIFMAMWQAVKEAYPRLWGGKSSALMKKVNINAMNEFLTDKVRAAWVSERAPLDIDDEVAVKKEVLHLLGAIPEAFWKEAWSAKIQDNANVRNMIKADLETMVINRRLKKFWHDDLKLVSVGSASE